MSLECWLSLSGGGGGETSRQSTVLDYEVSNYISTLCRLRRLLRNNSFIIHVVYSYVAIINIDYVPTVNIHLYMGSVGTYDVVRHSQF
jgi:hypothetical protein